MKVLVTGFAPFGGDTINPSYAAVRRLPARIVLRGGVLGVLDVVTAELPTSFARAPRKLRALIARVQPEIVLCVGLAAERAAICVERIAVNLCDARIADNDGAQPRDTPVVARAPAAYFSTLPVTAIVRALVEGGLRAEQSLSAGAFVCNHVFFGLMHASVKRPNMRAGFVHVPALPRGYAAREAQLTALVQALTIVLCQTSAHMRSRL